MLRCSHVGDGLLGKARSMGGGGGGAKYRRSDVDISLFLCSECQMPQEGRKFSKLKRTSLISPCPGSHGTLFPFQ